MSTDWAYLSALPGSKSVIQRLFWWQSGIIAVDVETYSIEDQTPIGFSIAINPNEAFWFDIGHTQYIIDIKLMLTNPNIIKVFHNGSFDKPILQHYLDIPLPNCIDTMYMAQLLGLPPRLNDLALMLINRKSLEIKDLLGSGKAKKKSMLEVPKAQVVEKCCLDTQVSFGCYLEMKDAVSPRALDLELRSEPFMQAAGERGLRIDLDRLQQHKEVTEKELKYYKTICTGMGFNPGSSLQVAWILKSRGHHVLFNKATGKPIMTEEVLRTRYINDPISHIVLKYRHARSRLSTQLEGVEKRLIDDRLYITFRQSGADSGRISTTPNSQNIEYDIRDMYIPSDGNELEVADFSQIELRIIAWMSQDPAMMAVFGRGESFHRDTARQMYGKHYTRPQYTLAKNLNFTCWYGGDDYTLWNRYQVPRPEGKEFIKKLFTIYARGAQWLEEQKEEIYSKQQATTLYGRVRLFPDIQLGVDWITAKNFREGINHIVQGTAGEVNKEAIIFCGREPMVNTVHDELVFDVPEQHKVLLPSANALAPFHSPIEWGRGYNWKEAKP